ncbi:S1/P1 nuclease [Bradyrhizobium sp. USDA 4461]
MRKIIAVAAGVLIATSGDVLAFGQEGHSIIAEIAQRRLNQEAAAQVERLLGKGHSLAAVGSWADDVRDQRPETYNWHFVDLPVAANTYQAGRDCNPPDRATKGDCVLAELDRLRSDLRCASNGRGQGGRSQVCRSFYRGLASAAPYCAGSQGR